MAGAEVTIGVRRIIVSVQVEEAIVVVVVIVTTDISGFDTGVRVNTAHWRAVPKI